jgi:hypothetical protein
MTGLVNPAKRGLGVPRIVIDVTGGVVNAVWADTSIQVRIIEGDEDPPEAERVINIAADHDKPEYVYIWGALAYGIQNQDIVDRIFNRTEDLF